MTTALHTLAHAWNDIENFGPWYVFWTLPLERYMKYMRANIFSGAYPAANFIPCEENPNVGTHFASGLSVADVEVSHQWIPAIRRTGRGTWPKKQKHRMAWGARF